MKQTVVKFNDQQWLKYPVGEAWNMLTTSFEEG